MRRGAAQCGAVRSSSLARPPVRRVCPNYETMDVPALGRMTSPYPRSVVNRYVSTPSFLNPPNHPFSNLLLISLSGCVCVCMCVPAPAPPGRSHVSFRRSDEHGIILAPTRASYVSVPAYRYSSLYAPSSESSAYGCGVVWCGVVRCGVVRYGLV